jgi:hypothetical protein
MILTQSTKESSMVASALSILYLAVIAVISSLHLATTSPSLEHKSHHDLRFDVQGRTTLIQSKPVEAHIPLLRDYDHLRDSILGEYGEKVTLEYLKQI